MEEGYRQRKVSDQLWPLRTRADQAHISTQNIPKLRELVQSGAAKEASDSGDSVVVLSRNNGTGLGFRVEFHGAKLDDLELAEAEMMGRTGLGAQETTGSALLEKDITGRLSVDQCSDDGI
jgi:hypothetical protein